MSINDLFKKANNVFRQNNHIEGLKIYKDIFSKYPQNVRLSDEVKKTTKKYKQIIKTKHDSLMTITEIKSFIWDNKKPINYNNKKVKWPKTQETLPLNKVNSAVFLSSKEN